MGAEAIFTKKQIEVIRNDNKHRPWLTICEGAIRSGKTRAILPLFMTHVAEMRGTRRRFIITGHTLGAIKRNVLDEITELYGVDTKLNALSEFSLFGNLVVCAGADTETDYKKITGFTAHGWYANEATLQHENTIRQAFGRCSGKGARVFWDTNPDAPNNHIKTNYIDKADGKRIKSWHFELEDNKFLTADYINNLKETTPSGVWYDRNILGLWVSAEGMIYKDWTPDLIVDIVPKTDKYIVGVDWGYREGHEGVMQVWADAPDAFYLVEEVAEIEKTIDYWKEKAADIRTRYNNPPFYCDTARPEYIAAIRGRDADKSVLTGIETVAGLIRKRQIKVKRGAAPLFEKEIYQYHWSRNAAKQEPEKVNDNSMDAMRYAIHTHTRARPIVSTKSIF